MARDREDARQEIVETARKMIAGEIDLLEGCRVILMRRGRLEGVHEALFLTLIAVESETDHFPSADTRKRWDSTALTRKDEQKERYLRQVEEQLLESCRGIIAALTVPSFKEEAR